MGEWTHYVWLCGGIVWFAATAWEIRWGIRQRRAMCQWMELNQLLRQLCVEACQAQHRPIWQAWAEVMGHLEITVKTRFREPEDAP